MTHNTRQAMLLMLAMGIQLGSTGAARLQEYFGTPLFSTATRIVCIVAVAVLILWGNRIFERRVAVLGIVASSAAQLICIALAWASEFSVRFALGVACTIAEGSGLALLMYLVLLGSMNLGRRLSGIVVACGYLIVNVWDSFFVSASAVACTVQWVVGIVLVPVLMMAWLRKEEGASRAIAIVNDEDDAMNPADEPVDASAALRTPFAPLVVPAICIILVLLITGIFVNFTGVGGTGDNAFFDLSVNIYLILIRLSVVAFVAVRPGRPEVVELAALGVVGLTLGVGLIVITWDCDNRFFGAMAVESLLYVMQPLILIAGMELARRYSTKMQKLLLASVGIDFSNHITRLATPFVMGDPSFLLDSEVARVASLAIGCTAICAALGWLLVDRKAAAHGDGLERPVSLMGVEAVADDPVLGRELAFYHGFCAMAEGARLAGREREVLYEAMHGYSADHIAERLAISSQTVKTYLGRAYQKLGVRTKQEALRLLDERHSDGE